jgi:hypothetical protein
MRRIAALLEMLLLAACSAPAVDRSAAPPQPLNQDAPLTFLLESSAADFSAHRPPYPTRLRDVRLGYLTTADGSRQYMLCGEFLPEGAADWVAFATIETDPYEQWIGGQAAAFCEQAGAVWIEGDQSSALQSRLDSLR